MQPVLGTNLWLAYATFPAVANILDWFIEFCRATNCLHIFARSFAVPALSTSYTFSHPDFSNTMTVKRKSLALVFQTL